MKKIILSAGFILACVCSSFAGTPWEIRGKIYNADTVYHEQIGPGTTLTKLVLDGPDTQRIFYTTTDLTNDSVEIMAVKGKNTAKGLEPVSSMAKRNSTGGKNCIVGVNSDFFERWPDSYPVGSVIVDREIVSIANKDWSAFGITSDRKPCLGVLSFNGKVKNGDCEHALDGVNRKQIDNGLVLYTRLNGDITGTGSPVAEVALEPLDGAKPMADGSGKYKVVSAPDALGSMFIPENGCVLSGSGDAAGFVKNLKEGDIVEADFEVLFDGKPVENLQHAVGGHPMILADSKVLDTDTAIVNLPKLNPRTAVGFNADRTRLILLVVDGRSEIAAGVISKQLAEIMRYAGCTDAMNFDGGGSSEMYTSKLGIVNTPSDGRERPVCDGLYVFGVQPAEK